MSRAQRKGPLVGLKVIELASAGPGPMCAMLLADLGATLIRIERAEPVELGIERPLQFNLLLRNRPSLVLDLKTPAGRDLVLRLAEKADALIEGFRPGVAERLGLGSNDLLARNPAIVMGRMTGWGQSGPLAQTAGHDLNYVALTGALSMIGNEDEPPPPPLNLLGDFGGGALYLAFGLLAAILEARQSGRGQAVDAAIVDGVASMLTTFHGMAAAGMLDPRRGANILDGGAYFYGCYRCGDGGWIAIGPIEQRFHAELLRLLKVEPATFPNQADRNRWPEARACLSAIFLTRRRDEWCEIFEGSNACVTPVLSLDEATRDPHMVARGTYIEMDGVVQPAPAPRFSRTPAARPVPPAPPNAAAALSDWLDPIEIEQLVDAGII